MTIRGKNIPRQSRKYSVSSSQYSVENNLANGTGLGKALLASYDEARVLSIVGNGKYKTLTENTLTNFTALKSELDRIRIQGYSLDNGENAPDISCVASLIREHSGKPVAALSVASPFIASD